jgi:hypothetical protein
MAGPLFVFRRWHVPLPRIFRSADDIRRESLMDMGPAKLPAVTCFMDQRGYLAVTLNSRNPKFLTFDTAKSLLREAAALRKSFCLSVSASVTRLMDRCANPLLD